MRTKASGESTLLLVDAVQVLDAAQVDYAIIGAMAASVHGAIRASRDAGTIQAANGPLMHSAVREQLAQSHGGGAAIQL